jgi:Peptidase family M28
MVGHNRDNDIDVFQISPGKGRGSLGLACQAHLANIAWNVAAEQWNQEHERRGKGRSQRSPDGITAPQQAEYPRLRGEVRLVEDPHSSLYNTDAQIFSDCGIPAVLLMENYDVNRSGYHDTKDTMANIDLDYGSALAAIAIEAVARAASQRSQ